jgi:superfamily II RNA helicase
MIRCVCPRSGNGRETALTDQVARGAAVAGGRDAMGRMSPASLKSIADAADADEVLERFEAWTTDQGISLYPAQEEAILTLLSGANVIMATPTGSGKSLVAVAAHRSWYTAPIKALVSEKFFDL